jgi:hypothetical protein
VTKILLRPCKLASCPTLTTDGWCDVHRRARQQAIDKRRGTPTERGYDASYRRLRVLCFERDGWRCVDCGWTPTIVKDFQRYELGDPPAEQVFSELRVRFAQRARHLHADHVIPIEQRPDLRLDLDNLATAVTCATEPSPCTS